MHLTKKLAVFLITILAVMFARADWDEFLKKPFQMDIGNPCSDCRICCSYPDSDEDSLSLSGPNVVDEATWPIELVRTFMPTLDSGGVKKKDINEFIFMNYAGGNLRKIIIDEQQMDILSYEADLWLNISWEMLRVESTNPATQVNVTVATVIKIWF